MKDEIIYNIFEYLETKESSFKNKALELLTNFAKYYHVPIKKQPEKDLKSCFKAFILNGKGYNVTINNLYNAL